MSGANRLHRGMTKRTATAAKKWREDDQRAAKHGPLGADHRLPPRGRTFIASCRNCGQPMEFVGIPVCPDCRAAVGVAVGVSDN
jgi:hypothetical protein